MLDVAILSTSAHLPNTVKRDVCEICEWTASCETRIQDSTITTELAVSSMYRYNPENKVFRAAD